MKPSLLTDGRMKLRHLVLVDILTERGTIIGAAAALHVTQPVVSRGLKELEVLLGVDLYLRRPRGMTPTEYGTVFTNYARAILTQLNQAEKHLNEITDATRGAISVGTHLAGSQFLLPRSIALLKERHPLLNVSVHETSPAQLLINLRAGRLDMVVGRLPQTTDVDLERHVMMQSTVRIVTGAKNPIANQSDLTPQDTASLPWIVPGEGTRLRLELEQWFTQNRLPFPENRVEATSFLTVRQLLLQTNMVAAIPGMAGIEDPRLAALPIELKGASPDVGLTFLKNRYLRPADAAMIRAVRAAAEEFNAKHSSDHEPSRGVKLW